MNIKNKITLSIAGLALSAASLSAQVVYNAGDIVLGFYKAGVSQTVSYNVGAGFDFRDGSLGSLVNLSSALSSVFGAGWATDTDLKWAASGVETPGINPTGFESTLSPTTGDPVTTLYVSRASGSALWGDLTNNQHASASQGMGSWLTGSLGGFSEQTADIDTNGAIYDVSLANTYEEWITGNSYDTFVGGIETDITQALDLQRLVTTGSGESDSIVATFQIDEFGLVSAVPEPSTYAAIISLLALAVAGYSRRRKNA